MERVSPAAGKIAPVEKTVRVTLPVESAFELFTSGIASWWPYHTHSVGGQQVESCVLEGQVGGRIYEVNKDGSQADWGRVLVWEPPHRLVFSWHPGREADSAQQVSVQFTATSQGTQVDLVHTGWELLGEQAAALRESYVSGWDYVLGKYVVRAFE